MKVYHTLKPIYNKNSKILILGSMPSVISLNKNFYYANRNNRFWNIMENLFLTKFNSNLEKRKFLLDNKIALWDVIKSCEIKGSSDNSIKNVNINDINYLIKKSNIKYIFVTGKKALYIYNKYLLNITKKEAFYLPSPSSANASYNLKDLTEKYKIILDYLNL